MKHCRIFLYKKYTASASTNNPVDNKYSNLLYPDVYCTPIHSGSKRWCHFDNRDVLLPVVSRFFYLEKKLPRDKTRRFFVLNQ